MQVFPAPLGPVTIAVYWLIDRERFENAGEVVDLGVTMLDFPRNESSAEHASIAYHRCQSRSAPDHKSVPGSFPEIILPRSLTLGLASCYSGIWLNLRYWFR